MIQPQVAKPLIGFNLTVTNQYEVTSYVIGTLHVVDEESFDNEEVRKIVAQCSCLYSEAGKHTFNLRPGCRLLKGNRKHEHIQARFPFDAAVALAAEKNKLPHVALDVGYPPFDAFCRDTYQKLAKFGPAALEQELMEKLAVTQREHLALLEMWKQGDQRALKELRQQSLPSLVERETRWCQTLIPHLQRTQEPIAIAVGALHVLGSQSLSQCFEDAGLKVKSIQSL